jgi:histidinol dehydrogenase
MLKRLDLRGVTGDLRAHLPRPDLGGEEPVEAVRAILADVEARGDAAVRELTERFDGVRLGPELRVPRRELDAALARLDGALRAALEEAAEAIRSFHEGQRTPEHHHERGGIRVHGYKRPVERAGLYVPGGRAVYPSTVLMTAVPAKVAGVAETVLCVPPDRGTGKVPDATLAAAALADVDELYPIGGAQAIGALAFGTQSIRPVDVIVGPGNVYVAVAKREVAGRGLVAVPSSFAGPSEVVVVADGTVPADFAAIDLIVQAEHGPGGLSWLLTWSDDVADRVSEAVERLVEAAPRRADILSTLDGGGYAVVCDGPEQALDVSNLIAPEHLELLCDAPERLVPLVRSAGAIFCGPLAPASIGDYLAGPNHVLPTFGSARYSSALTIDDFLKDLHVVTVEPRGLERVGRHVVALARAEGLEAHAQSILLRQADQRARQEADERARQPAEQQRQSPHPARDADRENGR